MPVPTSSQVVEALQAKNVALGCRSCGQEGSLKLEVAGLNLTSLGAAATNASVSTVRYVPVALLTCGDCGDTRLFNLTWLGFKPPY